MKGKVFTHKLHNLKVPPGVDGMPIVCPNCGHLNTYSPEKAIDRSFYCENCGF
jgi:predicted RNA-binding Zn-ribbon protein involved in translation (DUF1610 family)